MNIIILIVKYAFSIDSNFFNIYMAEVTGARGRLGLSVWEPHFGKIDVKKKTNIMRMIIVGPSNTGKSYLLSHLSKKYLRKLYEMVIVVCGSDDTAKEYQEIFNTKLVFKADTAHNILALKVMFATLKKEQEQREKIGLEMLKVLIIYDDYFSRDKKDDDLFNMCISGRHVCFSVILICHDLVLIDRVARDQATIIIATNQLNNDVNEIIMERYLLAAARVDPLIRKQFGDSKLAVKNYLLDIMQLSTKNNHVIVCLLDEYKSLPSGTFNDLIKIYKAP